MCTSNYHEYAFCEENISVQKFTQILNQNQNIKDNLFNLMNVRSLNKIENFLAMLPYTPEIIEIIAISETKLNNDNQNYVPIPNFQFHWVNSPTKCGGIGLYISKSKSYKIRPDLSLLIEQVEDNWVEIQPQNNAKPYIVGGIYFYPHSTIQKFQVAVESLIAKMNAANQIYYILGDFNINWL